MSEVRSGCLLLADISGYSAYLGGVELEHSHECLADLLAVVVGKLQPDFPVAKLEGDAVFCYDPTGAAEGSTLIGAVESCYFAFARHRRDIDHHTTCECDACRRIPDLDLKFVAHHGSFIEHDVAGNRELVGPDVVKVHRLLKNSVREKTGHSAYAFLTDECVTRMGLEGRSEEMTAHRERYEDIGEVGGWVLDLAKRWREEREGTRVFVSAAETGLVFEREVPAPREVVWDYLTSPEKRVQWGARVDRVEEQHPAGGARGVGTVTHCVHGKQVFEEQILDYRPFDYYSFRLRIPLGEFVVTVECTEVADERTLVSLRARPAGGMGQRVGIKLMGHRMRSDIERSQANLVQLLSGSGYPQTKGG